MSTVVPRPAGLLARVGVPVLVVAAGGMVFSVGALSGAELLARWWDDGERLATGWDQGVTLVPPMLIVCIAIWRFYLRMLREGAVAPESSYGSGYGSGDQYYSYADGGARPRNSADNSFLFRHAGYLDRQNSGDDEDSSGDDEESSDYRTGSEFANQVAGLLLVISLLLLFFCWALGGTEFLAVATSVSVLAVTAYHVLFVYNPRPVPRSNIITVWLVGYLLLWMGGTAGYVVSLPVFVIFWTAVGLVGGALLSLDKAGAADVEMPEVSVLRSPLRAADGERSIRDAVPVERQPLRKSPRRAHATAARSEFGRVPLDVVNVLTQQVRRVTGPILTALPLGAPEDIRCFTVRAVLDTTVADWRINENVFGLENVDVDDLKSFVEAAGHLADGNLDREGLAVYSACLSAFLADWLTNWNAEGRRGPPERSSVA